MATRRSWACCGKRTRNWARRSTSRPHAGLAAPPPARSPVELLAELAPGVFVGAGFVWEIEGDAVEQSVIARLDLGGLLVETRRHVTPSMRVEHDLVGAGGGIKGDLLAHCLTRLFDLFVIA